MVIQVLNRVCILIALSFVACSPPRIQTHGERAPVTVLGVIDSQFVEYHLIVAKAAVGGDLLLLSRRSASICKDTTGHNALGPGMVVNIRLVLLDSPVVVHRILEGSGRPRIQGEPKAWYTISDDDLDTIRFVWYDDTMRTAVYMSPDIVDRYYCPGGQ